MSGRDDQRGFGFPSGFALPDVPKPAPPPGREDRNTPSTNRWLPVLTPDQRAFADAVAYAINSSVGVVELAPHQDMPIRRERFNEDSENGFVLYGTDQGTDGNAAAAAVAAATGATDAEASRNVTIVSYVVPAGQLARIEDVGLWVDDLLGYRFVEFSLLTGGARSKTLNNRSLPFRRNEPIKIQRLVLPGATILLQASNTETEVPHLVRGLISGWTFPVAMASDNLKALVQRAASV